MDLLAGEIAIDVSAGGPLGAMLPPPQLATNTQHASIRNTPLARVAGESFMAKTSDSGEGYRNTEPLQTQELISETILTVLQCANRQFALTHMD